MGLGLAGCPIYGALDTLADRSQPGYRAAADMQQGKYYEAEWDLEQTK